MVALGYYDNLKEDKQEMARNIQKKKKKKKK